MQLKQLRSYALSLPETSEEPHFNFSSFRVKGKIFVTVPPDENYVHIFVDDERRDMAIALFPQAIEPLFWGKKILGVRVSLAKAKQGFVQELVYSAWARKAPKSLAKLGLGAAGADGLKNVVSPKK
jgi:hypothetical protein